MGAPYRNFLGEAENMGTFMGGETRVDFVKEVMCK